MTENALHQPGPLPAAGGADRVIRLSTAGVVLAVAGIAAYISYWHAYAVVREYGETGITAQLEPATIDGLVYASSMVLLYSARHRLPVPRLARWMLALGILATLAVNVAQGWSHGFAGAVVAAWPAASLVGSYEMLAWIIRTAAEPGPEQVPDAAPAADQTPGAVPDTGPAPDQSGSPAGQSGTGIAPGTTGAGDPARTRMVRAGAERGPAGPCPGPVRPCPGPVRPGGPGRGRRGGGRVPGQRRGGKPAVRAEAGGDVRPDLTALGPPPDRRGPAGGGARAAIRWRRRHGRGRR